MFPITEHADFFRAISCARLFPCTDCVAFSLQTDQILRRGTDDVFAWSDDRGTRLALAGSFAQADGQVESAQQLIKDVIFNELTDHQHHGHFQYLDVKRSAGETILKAEVETCSGRIHRILAEDGKPLTPGQQEEESRRLETLLYDSSQQQKLLRDDQGDEDRIARIVSLMPEGFIYQYDGVEGDDIRLKYQPNPNFKPPTYEARVFHGMAGQSGSTPERNG